MRSLLLAVGLSAALVGSVVAAASAVPKGGPNSFGCKVLRNAIHGTPVGAHLTVFVASGPNACVSDSGGDVPWRALLDLGLGSKHARAACKVVLADHSLHSRWLTKALSGADLACEGTSAGKVRFSDTIYFDKGRWSGIFGIEGPTSGVTGSVPLLLRRVTAQLPR